MTTTTEHDDGWREFVANAYQLQADAEPDETKCDEYLARAAEIRAAHE